MGRHEGHRLKTAQMGAALHLPRDKPRGFERPHVLGHGDARHWEGGSKLTEAVRPLCRHAQDRTAGRVGKRVEQSIQRRLCR